jgi:hypothetical protein
MVHARALGTVMVAISMFVAMACSGVDDPSFEPEAGETATSPLFYSETGAKVYYDSASRVYPLRQYGRSSSCARAKRRCSCMNAL